uniref:Gypsy retrotransposon integrase-like protein 1 n=1 Tax=Sparus aurata TaxID=8175 RepID=A0A671UCI0_SPAAU
MLLEEFKNRVPERTVVYLNEQKVSTLQQAAILADEFALTHKSSFVRHESPAQHETAFRPSDTRAPRPGTSVSAPKADKQCFFCHKADHLIADCSAWKCKQQAATSKPKGVGLVRTVTSCPLSAIQTVPDECFKPFIFPAFVSLTGKVDDQRPVTVLRDTGGSQSFILSTVLPLSEESACDASAIVRGIGMGFVPAPLHRIHVQSNLKTGFFRVAVRASFPIDGVDFIMGNDIAGGKVYPSPEVVDNPMAESRHDDLVQCHPDVFSVSVLTRGQARKQAQDVDLSDSVFASALSENRLPPMGDKENCTAGLEKCESGAEPVAAQVLPLTREALISSQSGDPSLRKCFAAVEDVSKCTESQSFFIENRMLMRKWISPLEKTNVVGDLGSVCQIVIPAAYRQHVLELAHDHPWSGHLGVTKTYDRILKHFFWPGMKKEVARFCKTCSTCQVVGKPNQVVPPAPLHPIPAVGEPFEHVLVDCVGPLPRTKSGNQFLLTVMCITTRFPEAIPLRKITAPAITRALTKFFTMFGVPKVVQTDQGTNFLSKSFKQTLHALGIVHSVCRAYHPQSQGALEHWHQTLTSMLRKYCYETGRDWDDGVPFTLFAIREAKQESLGFSPAELVFGHSVRGPLKVLKEQFLCNVSPQTTVQDFVSRCKERLRYASALAKVALSSSQERMKERFDQKAVKREFEPGERVLVLLPTPGSALTAQFSGPYFIKSKVSDTNYVIHTPERRRKVRLCHINMLKSYHSRETNEGERERTLKTAAPCETTTSLVCVESLPDDGLALLGSDQQSGRLSNTEFLAKIDAHLNYLPVDQRREMVSLIRSHPSLFSDVPSSNSMRTVVL